MVDQILTSWNHLAHCLGVLDGLRRLFPEAVCTNERRAFVIHLPRWFQVVRAPLRAPSLSGAGARRRTFIDAEPPRATLRSALASAVSAVTKSSVENAALISPRVPCQRRSQLRAMLFEHSHRQDQDRPLAIEHSDL